jgi:hypothetical protein
VSATGKKLHYKATDTARREFESGAFVVPSARGSHTLSS